MSTVTMITKIIQRVRYQSIHDQSYSTIFTKEIDINLKQKFYRLCLHKSLRVDVWTRFQAVLEEFCLSYYLVMEQRLWQVVWQLALDVRKDLSETLWGQHEWNLEIVR